MSEPAFVNPLEGVTKDGEVIPLSSTMSLRGRVLRVGWELPEDLSEAEWRSAGELLGKVQRSVSWWIGDWWAFGEHRWRDRKAIVQANNWDGPDFQTCMNTASVCRAFKETSRRREVLSFTHHAEAAGLPPEVADAILDEAAAKEASVSWVRQRVKEHNRARRQIPPDNLPPLPERCQLIKSAVSELATLVPANSVDWIITDPPYPEEFLPVYEELAVFGHHALKPGGSCIVMCGQSYLPQIIEYLGRWLEYHWVSAYLPPGGQAVQLWDRKVNTFWKPLLWFVKVEYSSGDWVGDVLKSDPNDNDKRFHDWGQSESGMLDIVRRFTRAGDIICDPFLGAGTTGLAALALDRIFIGADISDEAIIAAKSRIALL